MEHTHKSDAYAKDGVNVKTGDDFSALAADVCRSTFKSSRFVEVRDFAKHNFRGPRGFRLKNLPKNYWLDMPSDGIGTKVGLITEALSHNTAAFDLLAMAASDISRYGGIPLVMANVLDVSSLGEANSSTLKAMAELASGLGMICRIQRVVLVRGETAELGPYVSSENPDAMTKFNWSCTILGAYHPERIITGKTMKPGDAVVALQEEGFRSNGLSSVRKALAKRFGREWWSNTDAKESILAAARPSVLYDTLLARANGWYDPKFKPIVRIKAIAHISGGGIPGKFGEDLLFPRGLSANLNPLFAPPPIMTNCLQWHEGMNDEESYRTWNGGQGMLVVMNRREVPAFRGLARVHGIGAEEVGEITSEHPPVLRLRSGYTGRELVYRPATRT